MKAGFIGYRGFAQKLRMLFAQSGHVNNFLFFHPDKSIEGECGTARLEDLESCDFIVIASPDWTHGDYLRNLKDYSGYIFCEKVPVLSMSDFSFLKNTNNPRLYFNFNYRKSKLYTLLKSYEDQLLHISYSQGHGLAFQDKYEQNWRSSLELSPLGVFELSGIHFFDLLIYCFGSPVSYHTSARNFSPYGKSFDNFSVTLEFDKITAHLFSSYTCPFHDDLKLVTFDRIFNYNGKELTVHGPRETLDKSGRFAVPPVISREEIDFNSESLKASIDYFLEVVQNKDTFYETESDSNLTSTELFLNIVEKYKN